MSHESWDTKGDRSPWLQSSLRIHGAFLLKSPFGLHPRGFQWENLCSPNLSLESSEASLGLRTHAFVGPCCNDRSPPLCHWYSFHEKGSTGSFPPLGRCLVTKYRHIYRISQAFWKTWPMMWNAIDFCWFWKCCNKHLSVVSSSLSVLSNALQKRCVGQIQPQQATGPLQNNTKHIVTSFACSKVLIALR